MKMIVTWGRIRVDQKDYAYDVVVDSDNEVREWRRNEGDIKAWGFIHLLKTLPQDLIGDIDILIIGTGHFGFLRPSRDLSDQLRESGIDLVCARSKHAARLAATHANTKRRCLLMHVKC